ncbi:MAG: membrane protein insertase YidC [Candidatus Latescibacteria bacterium]|nr:membrane protein insertase YidC [Candidatus Latescibacterota bacterium]NIM22659.1 membrane protein insertase YidC [Candidatus Latescibacterota bacterium]NIM64948.1 membrane protein insertase YidC [Candidatus Latescibacterota bacterium]NIO01463.1 membrane protein insertase YidC [Candidatus Latescibacterota bacterium]NIO27973.1 membrane protein insertase YidC [Candidatus Latescibacterota bacterium]
MSLEKRAFFAFILSMLLFLVYDYLYLAPKMKERQALRRAQMGAMDSARTDSLPTGYGEAQREPVSPPETPVSQPLDVSGTSLPVARPDSAGIITVVTPLYQLVFSKAGGEIRSVELFEYETAGRPVELLPRDSISPGLAEIGLRGETREISLSNSYFNAYLGGVGKALPDGYRLNVDEMDDQAEIVFRTIGEAGQTVERYYRITGGGYAIQAGVRFNVSAFPFARQIVWGFGPGMTSTEENKKDDYQNFQASIRLGEEIHRRKPGHFSEKKVETYSGTVAWGTLQTKYFTIALVPEAPTGGEVEITGDRATHLVTGRISLPTEERRGAISQAVTIYLGPLDYGILKSMGVGLERNINMGWKLFRPVSWVILWALIGLYKLIPNYGVVIILLSVITKVLFYRLTHKSFKSMRDMQALQPKLQALKEKYKDDRQKISQETMRLYKEHGVNPLGGCLPLLLQMPVFIALFSVLKFTIEVRGAYFFGWITDLSQQDVLARLPFSLPFIGSEVSLLPLLMGAAMLFQTKIGGSMTPGSSTTQPKIFNYMLPIVFTVIFYKMPSGLVLYWFVNNILTIAQQYYINKDVSKEETADEKPGKTKAKQSAGSGPPAKRPKSKNKKARANVKGR